MVIRICIRGVKEVWAQGFQGCLAWRCSFGLWQSLGAANMDIKFLFGISTPAVLVKCGASHVE